MNATGIAVSATAVSAAAVEDEAPVRALRKDAARNRQLLIDTAREVFAEHGLEATLDDVAHRAGLGVGTAYRHFANKYELAAAVFNQAIDDVVEYADAGLAMDDAWAGLLHFLECTLAAQAENRGLREVILGVHDPEAEHRVTERLTGRMIALVERAQAAGRLRPEVRPADIGMIMVMLCTVADVAGDVDPEQWRRYLPTLLAGLRPDGPELPLVALTDAQMRSAMAAHKQRLLRATRGGAER